MVGPGKYDHLCTTVRELARAEGAIVIVLNGYAGNGFSVQSPNPELIRSLPRVLREMADSIDKDTLENDTSPY